MEVTALKVVKGTSEKNPSSFLEAVLKQLFKRQTKYKMYNFLNIYHYNLLLHDKNQESVRFLCLLQIYTILTAWHLLGRFPVLDHYKEMMLPNCHSQQYDKYLNNLSRKTNGTKTNSGSRK